MIPSSAEAETSFRADWKVQSEQTPALVIPLLLSKRVGAIIGCCAGERDYFDRCRQLARRQKQSASACREDSGKSHRSRSGRAMMRSQAEHSKVKVASFWVPSHTPHVSY